METSLAPLATSISPFFHAGFPFLFFPFTNLFFLKLFTFGGIALALLKATAVVVVLSILLIGGVLVKLFGVGLAFFVASTLQQRHGHSSASPTTIFLSPPYNGYHGSSSSGVGHYSRSDLSLEPRWSWDDRRYN